MLVAIPTAIPAAPLTMRLGSLDGRTVGSCSRSSKLGTKSTVLLSMSSSIAIAMRVRRILVKVGAAAAAPASEPQVPRPSPSGQHLHYVYTHRAHEVANPPSA